MTKSHLSLLAATRPGTRRDLYTFYDQFRAADPCVWDRVLGAWVVTSYELVSAAAGDARLSSVRYPDPEAVEESLRPVAAVFARQMLYTDPPDHARVRRAVSASFAARAVESLRAPIADAVDRILDRVAPRGGMDFVGELAVPLPFDVICTLLQVPDRDREQVLAWSGDLAVAFGNARLDAAQKLAASRAATRLTAYFDGLLDTPATFLRPGSAVGLTREEVLANAVLLLLAGHETTTHFLGNALFALLGAPGECARLRADPALLPRAVEELLRFESPLQVLWRRAGCDLDLGGRQVRAGDPVLLVCGAANRDPAAFDAPHTLDLARAGSRQLAFGHGPHVCAGSALARLEGEIVLGAVLARLPGLRPAGPEPTWRPSLNFRGLERLELRWDVPGTAVAGPG